MSRRLSEVPLNAQIFQATFATMNAKTASKTWLCQALSPANEGDFKNAAGAVFVVFRGGELFGAPFEARSVEVYIRPDWQWCCFVRGRKFDAATVLAKFVDLRSLTALTLTEHVSVVLDATDTFVSTLVKCERVLASSRTTADANGALRATLESWSNTKRAVTEPDAVHKHGQPLTHVKGENSSIFRSQLTILL
jgi:hypothetical protein